MLCVEAGNVRPFFELKNIPILDLNRLSSRLIKINVSTMRAGQEVCKVMGIMDFGKRRPEL